MAKIHLRRNVVSDRPARAACATNPYIPQARRNQRSSYQFMASEIVSWEQFRTLDSKLLCSHCLDACLVIRNRQRKAKGMPPVTQWNQ